MSENIGEYATNKDSDMVFIRNFVRNETTYSFEISREIINEIIWISRQLSVYLTERDVVGLLRSFKEIYIERDNDDSFTGGIGGNTYLYSWKSNPSLVGIDIYGNSREIVNLAGYGNRDAIQIIECVEFEEGDLVSIDGVIGQVYRVDKDSDNGANDVVTVSIDNKIIMYKARIVRLVCRAENREDRK